MKEFSIFRVQRKNNLSVLTGVGIIRIEPINELLGLPNDLGEIKSFAKDGIVVVLVLYPHAHFAPDCPVQLQQIGPECKLKYTVTNGSFVAQSERLRWHLIC